MSDHSTAAPIVSFDDEPLILVDSEDNVLGYKPKAEGNWCVHGLASCAPQARQRAR